MLSFAFKYRAAINAMTADKALKLRKFKLEDEEWLIVKDLVALLLVMIRVYYPFAALTLMHRNTKMRHSFSPRTRLALPRFFPLWFGSQALSTSRLEMHTTLQSLRP